MKKRKQSILSLMLALCLVFAMSMSVFASATSANSLVNADSTGTLQIKVGVTDLQDSTVFHPLQTGTGFLINDTTMATCFHVVDLGDKAIQFAMEAYGMTEKQVKERTVIKVFLYRDDSYTATIAAKSVDADIAILSLKDSIKNRTYLSLRTSEVERSEQCYALGFPGIMGDFDDQELNTAADVSIDEGIVNKITTVSNIKYVVNSAKTVEGNSGGPLVDAEGHVIGVVQAYTSSLEGFADGYSYAITIDEVVNLLTPRGIAFTESTQAGTVKDTAGNDDENKEQGGETAVKEEAPAPVDKSGLQSQIAAASSASAAAAKCSEATKSSFDTALTNANTLNTNQNATQAEVDAAASTLASAIDKVNEEASNAAANNKMFMTIGIIAAAVVVAAIVMILLMGGKKKKAAPAPAPSPIPAPGPIPAPAPAPAYNPGGVGTSVLNQGAGETTVLNAGAGETTVLNDGVSLGTLTRVSTGEKISINKDGFTIGKERNSVDYCVTGNSSVSRKHAVITSEGGSACIIDNGSTNGTSVNNVRLAPKHKNMLNDGDRIQISDEEFIYNTPAMF